jgi:hypothetical protein
VSLALLAVGALLVGEAGGPVTLPGCPGAFPRAPQHRAEVSPGAPLDLRVLSDGGTALVVRTPAGRLACLPHARELNFTATDPGTYDVFVGSEAPGVSHPFVFYTGRAKGRGDVAFSVAENAGAAPTYTEEIFGESNTRVDGVWQPDLSVGPATAKLKGRAGGDRAVPGCAGRFPPVAQHRIRKPKGHLRLWVPIGVAVLHVTLPDGTTRCGPLVDVDPDVTGELSVLVGTTAPEDHDYTLVVHDRGCAPTVPLCGVEASAGVRRPVVSPYLVGHSGGPVQLGAACPGFFPATPSHTVTARGAGTSIALLFSDGGTSLLARIPQAGTFQCTGALGTDATLFLAPGTYELFVGSDAPGVAHPYAVALVPDAEAAAKLSRKDASWEVGRRFPSRFGLRFLYQQGELTHGANTLTSGGPVVLPLAAPAATRLAGQPGDAIAASELVAGCEGTIPLDPQHRIQLDPPRKVRLWVADPDGVAVVRTGDGRSFCLAAGPHGPVQDIEAGSLEVFVGRIGDQRPPYVLHVGAPCPLRPLVDPLCRGPMKPMIGMGFGVSAQTLDGRGAPVVRTLEAVVRIETDAGHLCSATVVRRGPDVGVITAAHCLFEIAGGVFGRRRPALRVAGEGELAVDRATIAPGFAACAARGGRYAACLRAGPDLAFVPLRKPPHARPWRLCTAPPRVLEAVTLGYGLDRGTLATELLAGDFVVRPLGAHVWSATSRIQTVEEGDSGGPTVVGARATGLPADPEVCFVTAATTGREAILEPVWLLP